MLTAITTGIIVFVVVVLFLIVARRVLSIAVKLAVVGVLVILLVSGAGYGWWRGWFDSARSPASRSNTNRRSAR